MNGLCFGLGVVSACVIAVSLNIMLIMTPHGFKTGLKECMQQYLWVTLAALWVLYPDYFSNFEAVFIACALLTTMTVITEINWMLSCIAPGGPARLRPLAGSMTVVGITLVNMFVFIYVKG